MNSGIMTVYGGGVGLDQSQLPLRDPGLFHQRRANTRLTRREKLPWPSGEPFKILSLDGGGIRGLYGATVLARIEQQLTGEKSIARYFDMIAGTSTGGIMAIGLGLQIPAEKIKALYRDEGRDIFYHPKLWEQVPGLKLLHHIRNPLYNHNILEKKLQREFSNRTLGQSITRLVIPAFLVPNTEIAVFKTDHHSDYKNDYKSLAWEIARSTSAAPTYFGGHRRHTAMFLDGGIWANNPVMIAIVDALSAYDISRDQIQVFSIGTGNSPLKISLSNARTGLWGWRQIIRASMFLTTDNAHAQAVLLLGPENIMRMEPSHEAAKIDLDDWESAAKVLPSMAEQHFSEKETEISAFFQKQVIPRSRFYTTNRER